MVNRTRYSNHLEQLEKLLNGRSMAISKSS